jgi:uncharacterized protein
MAKAATEVVQELYGAFGAGDVPGIMGRLAEDVVWDFPGPAEYPVFARREGLAAAMGFFQALAENEDIHAFEPRSFHADGDTVLVLGHVSLTLRKNGQPVAYDWAHVFTVQGGKVLGFKGFTDTAAIVDAYRR